jgi:hypothetical protein
MFISEEKFVDVLSKSGLSPNQYLFAYLIHKGNFPLMYRYVREVGRFKLEDIQTVLEKGYIIDVNKDRGDRTETFPDHYIPTSSFKELMINETEDDVEELWEIYPPFILINGNKAPGKSTDISVLAKPYSVAIKGSPDKHQEVKEILEWAIEKKVISMGFEKFILGRGWEFFKAMKESGHEGDIIVNL